VVKYIELFIKANHKTRVVSSSVGLKKEPDGKCSIAPG
jgi:hypothetical protein